MVGSLCTQHFLRSPMTVSQVSLACPQALAHRHWRNCCNRARNIQDPSVKHLQCVVQDDAPPAPNASIFEIDADPVQQKILAGLRNMKDDIREVKECTKEVAETLLTMVDRGPRVEDAAGDLAAVVVTKDSATQTDEGSAMTTPHGGGARCLCVVCAASCACTLCFWAL